MLSRIKSIFERKALFKKINTLQISSSGVDADGDPFVELQNGTIFYGNKSPEIKFDRFFYDRLEQSVKSVLKYECRQVAKDIIIRYVEGGLKYGGPKKQSRYKVKTGDQVAEMGAFQGFCSVKLAQQVGESGTVTAIEPMPDNFRLLKKNAEANKLSQIKLVNQGVWDSRKTLHFNRRVGDGQSSSIEMSYEGGEKVEVTANTLDNIFSGIGTTAKDFMIIQLNGAEINALRGLDSFKPKNLSIAARYDTESEDAALAIKNLLEKRGYSAEIDTEDFVFAEHQS